eukprot:TRINITY_DN825_c1_g1_i1.p1 TRINITY_DN825_c1_g1~~TRINITY_DN825_c1_g1_i1.p1  ORF type:complete len:107 (-),score=31.61 TRINITY_DN825_c1_g1_i1:170-490(-)
MVEAGILKEIKIKTGAVKRLFKELQMYEQEVGQFQAKRDKVAEGEASELKHFNNMIEESKSMVTDTTRRLEQFYDELCELVDENESSDAEVVAAKSILDQVEPLFE